MQTAGQLIAVLADGGGGLEGGEYNINSCEGPAHCIHGRYRGTSAPPAMDAMHLERPLSALPVSM